MNKIILIGNLTRDPEMKTTQNGYNVCDFTIAVNKRRYGQQQQQQAGQQSDADFFRIRAWRQLGENCQKYVSKGRKVFVSGPLEARTYQANDGTTRVSLEVTAEDVEFLSSRAKLRRWALLFLPIMRALRPRAAVSPLWKPTNCRFNA